MVARRKYDQRLDKIGEINMKRKLLDLGPSKKNAGKSASIKKNEAVSAKDIAIIGIGLKIRDASTIEAFWKFLEGGVDCIVPFPEKRKADAMNYLRHTGVDTTGLSFQEAAYLEEIDAFDYGFFKLSPREAALMDPNQRMFLQTAWTCVEDAGYGGRRLRGSKTGVFIGFSGDGEGYSRLVSEAGDAGAMQAMPGNLDAVIPSRISYLMDFKGPSVSVNTACSSALAALHWACRSLRSGECHQALVGTVRLKLMPLDTGVRPEIMSSDGRTKAFDDGSDGTGAGEGVIALMLKPLHRALRDHDYVYAVIKGTAMNQDGNSIGITAPNAGAQAEVILSAWDDAGIDPTTVSFIEAHGTGTVLGDPIEVEGITKAFRYFTDKKGFCALGSVKSNIGHLDCGAGLAGLLKAVLALKHRKIPPMVHFQTPNKKINFADSPVHVNDELLEWTEGETPRRCGVSSFGLSGTNCHVVLEEAPVPNGAGAGCGPFLLALSARTDDGLARSVERYIDCLKSGQSLPVGDICYTSNVGRGHYNRRLAVVAASRDDLAQKLEMVKQVGLDAALENVFHGGFRLVPANKTVREAGELTEEDIAALTAASRENFTPDLTETARSYVKGASIDWQQLYESGDYRTVPVPTYPFASHRCWLELAGDAHREFSIDVLLETEGQTVFSAQCRRPYPWMLGEHRVNGVPVMVGTAYIEMVLTAAQLLSPGKSVELRDFVLAAPLTAPEDGDIDIHIIISGDSSEEKEVRLVSRASTSDNREDWRTHASGRIVFFDRQPFETIDVDALLNQCPREFTPQAQVGDFIGTGPRWDCLDKVLGGEQCWLGLLELPHRFRDDLERHPFHPALLDKAIHCAAVADTGIREAPYLPMMTKRIRVFGPIPSAVLSLVARSPEQLERSVQTNNDTVSFDITILDHSGNVLAILEDYTLKQVRAPISTIRPESLLHHIRWVETSAPESGGLDADRKVLLLKGEGQWPQRLEEALKSRYGDVVAVPVEGDRQVEGYDRLWEEVGLDSLDLVVHCGSFTAPDQQLDGGTRDLFHMVQSLGRHGKGSLDLLLVAPNAHRVTGEEAELHPLGAAFLTLGQTVGQEYPHLRCYCIDVDRSDPVVVLRGIGAPSGQGIVAIRENRVYRQEYAHLTMHKETSDDLLKEDGVYLITGGLGGIGLEMARFLAKSRKVKLAICGRRALPLKPEALLELEANGSQVEYFSADCADVEHMKMVVDAIHQSFGTINGIIHCAGVAGDGFLARKTDDAFENVLGPKIVGAYHLDALTRHDSPDFLVLCSSITALSGGVGQGDYAAANAFLDSFSHWRNGEGFRTLAIDWAAWLEVGMAKDFGVDLSKSLFQPLKTSGALAAFAMALEGQEARVAIAKPNLDVLAELEAPLPIKLSESLTGELQMRRRRRQPKPDIEESEKKRMPVQLTGRGDNGYSAAETAIGGIWGSVLGFAQLDLFDNFYELGGDSIIALQIVNQVNKELGSSVSVTDIFAHQTVRDFAAFLDGKTGTGANDETGVSDSIVPVGKQPHYPVSAAQKRLFVLNRMDNSHTGYNLPDIRWVEGPLDSDRLQEALSQLVQRHDMLRTSFRMVDGEPVQVILRQVDVAVELFEAAGGMSVKEEDVLAFIDAFIRPFDLGIAPLLRVGLVKLAPEKHILMFDIHHIAADAMGCDILVKEFAALYNGDDLVPLPVQYADFAAWQRQRFSSGAIDGQKEYWMQIFGDSIPVLDLATDFPRPAVRDFSGDVVFVSLERGKKEKLQSLARNHEATLYMVLLAVYYILLHKYSRDGQEDIVIGSAALGRSHADVEGLIGMFVNTLAIRSYPNGHKRFEQLLKEVKASTIAAFDHQDMPFDQLVEALDIERDLGRSPLTDVLFSFMSFDKPSTSRESLALGDLTFSPYQGERKKSSKADIALFCLEGDTLDFSFEYCSALFLKETMERMARHFLRIIDAIIASPECMIEDVNLLTEGERRQLLYDFNDTELQLPQSGIFLERFLKSAGQHPHRMALIDNSTYAVADIHLTYGELNRRSGGLAAVLSGYGVEPGSIVPICMEPSVQLIIAMLAIMKTGAAFLPIDPSFPEERIRFIVADCNASVGLAGSETPEVGGVTWLAAESIETTASAEDLSFPTPIGSAPAYVIYTSGSTGKPKGVLVKQRSLLNLCCWHQRQFDLAPRDRCAKYAGVGFDASVWEIFPALWSGVSLFVVPPELKLDPSGLNHFFEKSHITISFLPTQICEQFMKQDNHSLRMLLTGGDRLKEYHECGYTVVNNYGPTENTVVSTCYLSVSEENPIPIGRPIANTNAYVLSPGGKLQPIGVPGELWVGGEGLAEGYLNRPELTAHRFKGVEGLPHQILYRTGDLVRMRADGNILFVGRTDHQVKIRGYRIELGEIEACLASHPQLREVAVVALKNTAGEQYVAAYYTSGNEHMPAAALKDFVGGRLPHYMIPACFCRMEALPLTANGKIDTRGLPKVEAITGEKSSSDLPEGRMQLLLAGIWKEVLGVDRVGIDDNFFDIGGNSLNIISANSLLKERLGQDIPVVTLFQFPTIRALAGHLGGHEDEVVIVEPKSAPGAPGMDIAVVGMSVRVPGAGTVEDFWGNLSQGVESITFFSPEELEGADVDPKLLGNPNFVRAGGILQDFDWFDAEFFGYTPREAQLLDPQIRLFHECVYEALEHAGYDPGSYAGDIGLYAGASSSFYWEGRTLLSGQREALGAFGSVNLVNRDFLCSRVAYSLNLTGPVMTVQTACSTSLAAILYACRDLASGACHMAIAGGVSLPGMKEYGYIYEEGMIQSSDGHCRAFDKEADGTVYGRGAGVVVLKPRLKAAEDRDTVYAVVKGGAANNDGRRRVGYTAPSVEGQAEVIRRAQAEAGFASESISYIEAHGTGTRLGDPIEAAALAQAFGNASSNTCAIGSVKTNIGHLDAAAGAAGFIKTVLSLYHKKIPPSLHFKSLNPAIDFENSPFYVNHKLKAWDIDRFPRRAGVSSFGIGGTNVHIALEEANLSAAGCIGEHSDSYRRDEQLLCLSARNPEALEESFDHLHTYLKGHPSSSLADVAYTLQRGRKPFAYRWAAVCNDIPEALDILASRKENGISPGQANDRVKPSVVFLFPGQGAQYVEMGRGLYEHEPVFRKELDRCFAIMQREMSLDLKSILFSPAEADDINQTSVAQPLLVAFEYALARLLIHWGIEPAAMMGHSIGEYTAACVAGVLDLEDMLNVVVRRGRLMQGMPTGAMLSVPLSKEDLMPLMDPGLSLAAHNSSNRCVVSGPLDVIDRFEAMLRGRDIQARRLHTSHAFHSAMMEPVLDDFSDEFNSVTVHEPRLRYISNLTGDWMSSETLADRSYWANHIRGAVRFCEGLDRLFQLDNPLFLEVGPGNALSTFVRQHKQCDPALSRKTFNLVRHPREEVADRRLLLQQMGKLWMWGQIVDWESVNKNCGARRVPLPTYPFQRQRYWVEVDQATRGDINPSYKQVLRKRSDISSWFYIPGWERMPLPVETRELKEERHVWLVFCDSFGWSDLVCEELVKRDQLWISVRAGDGFRRTGPDEFTLNPAHEEDYVSLFRELAAADMIPERILHCWSVCDGESGAVDPERGMSGIINLARAIGSQLLSTKLKIGILSDRLADVSGEEEIVPLKSTMLGPVKVIPVENPNISCVCMDVGPLNASSPAAGRIVAQVVEEFKGAFDKPLVAFRGVNRWLQTMRPYSLPRNQTCVHFREGGLYLITGGRGGVGWLLAQYLAENFKARLVLVGRSFFPEPPDWDRWLADHPEEDDICRRIEKIREWRDIGASVTVVSADVTDETRMSRLLAQIKEKEGRIEGVFHTAAVVDEAGIVQNRSRHETEAVMAPKVKGTLILEKLLAQDPPDFMVLFSSLTNILYRLNFAQVGYQAANEFLEAYSVHRMLVGGVYTVTVNLSGLQEVGMMAEAARKKEAKHGYSDHWTQGALTTEEGVETICRILGSGQSRVSVSPQDLDQLVGYMNKRVTPKEAVETGAPVSGSLEERLELLWMEAFGVSALEPGCDFYQMGGDSLLAVKLISRINKEFSTQIPPHSLLNHKTIDALAQLVRQQCDVSTLPEEDDSSSNLIRIQQGSPGHSPLFLVHPIGGTVYFYKDLASTLGEERPVYGLQALGVDGGREPLDCIDGMARLYIEAIKAIQPQGPYYLGGSSFGGMVAFEMALQLNEAGESIGGLFMIDTPGPGRLPGSFEDDADILAHFVNVTNRETPVMSQEIRELQGEDLWAFIMGRLDLGPDNDADGFRKQGEALLKVFKANAAAMLAYHPRLYRGRLTFFQALHPNDYNAPDPKRAWESWIGEGLEIKSVPGDHYTMNSLPHVGEIGAVIEHRFNEFFS
jgi:amino acid adenylation domain-containing protein